MRNWTNIKLRAEMNRTTKLRQDAYVLGQTANVKFLDRKITNLSAEMTKRGM